MAKHHISLLSTSCPSTIPCCGSRCSRGESGASQQLRRKFDAPAKLRPCSGGVVESIFPPADELLLELHKHERTLYDFAHNHIGAYS